MSTNSHDRWLLPRRQTELPLRDLLPEETLHARRELTFLVLAVLALLPVAVLALVGVSHVIDLSALVESIVPDVELPIVLALPLGVVPFALSLVAVALACELFGGRRAFALALAGSLSAFGLAGLVRIADVVTDSAAFGSALALAAATTAALLAYVLVLDGLRGSLNGRARFVRIVVAAFVACALGFGALVGAIWLEAASDLDVFAWARPLDAYALASGSAAWTFALAFVLAIPAALAARWLAVALRVGPDVLGPVDNDDVFGRNDKDAIGGDDYVYGGDEDALVREPAFIAPSTARPASRHARGSSQLEPVAVSAFDSTVRAVVPPPGRTERMARVMTAVEPPALAEGSASRSLPSAEIVDEDVVALRKRTRRESLQPFSSAEMRFFDEGDALD